MKRGTFVNRTWWSVVGVATAFTTTAAAWAPVTYAAPTVDMKDAAVSAHAADAADRTYESCAAYFGFGKSDFDVLDIVDFDVADQNGPDGVSHAVGTDTQVVLELTNEGGDVLECTPVEVTETMWDDAMDDVNNNVLDNPAPADHPLPAWPGPGHYIYPSVNFEPYVGGSGSKPGSDFGTVTGVGFMVTSIPNGHTLVSPTGVKPLDVHYPAGESWATDVDPLVRAYLTAQVGSDAAAAYAGLEAGCGVDPGGSGADLDAASNAIWDLLGYPPLEQGQIRCVDGYINSMASFRLNVDAIVNYSEPITLSLPEKPTTTTSTTTSTTAPTEVAPVAAAAKPVKATPAYTG